MGLKKKILVLLSILLMTASVSAQEANWYINKPIVDIQFEGNKTISEIELKSLLKSYIGVSFTESLSWEIQGKLYALEYFDYIIPSALPGDENYQSVILQFQVNEKPVIQDIIFEGNAKVRRGELRDIILLKKGSMISESSLRLDEQAIVNTYIEKGFVDVVVDSEIEINEANNTSEVYFYITEGSQTKVSDIIIEGVAAFEVKDLRSVMNTKSQSMFNKGNYVESILREDLDLIVQYYKDRGYIDAEVLDMNTSIISDPEDPTINNMVITISISEGDQYLYTGVEFEGNSIYDDELLYEQMLQKTGKIYNDSRFKADYQRIVELYYENGYIYNKISYEFQKNEELKEISVLITIVETERAHIQNIVLDGNDKTKDHVILRELPFETGDVFSRKKIYQGVMNLYNTQYFANIEPEPVPGDTPGLMDMIIHVEEGRTSDIQFQLTFAGGPDFPVAGKIILEDKNFAGLGYKVSTEATVAPNVQSLALKFYDAWLFGERFGGGFDITYTHTAEKSVYQDSDGNQVPDPYVSQHEFEENGNIVPSDLLMDYESHYVSLGFSTGYSFYTPIGRFPIKGGVRTGFEYILYDPAIFQPYSESLRDNLESWMYSDSVWVSFAWDTRDIAYAPTKGFVISQNFTLAGVLDASNKQFLKSTTRADLYLKFLDVPVNDYFHFKGILKIHTAYKYIFDNPFYNTPADVQLNGHYVDGMFTAKGWNPESGYLALWDNSITLQFPFAKNILAFDLFAEAVGTWRTEEDLSEMGPEDFRCGIGGGIRIDNFQFPIAFYLVRKFRYDTNTNSINWEPEPNTTEFQGPMLDFVLSFNMDIYGM